MNELEKKYKETHNTPAKTLPTKNPDVVACPLCGHWHHKATKSNRCSYCGQKLDV